MKRQASYTFLGPGDWSDRITALDRLASCCNLCPRCCGVDRFSDKRGFCRAPGELVISSIFPHHGEEPPLSGECGSGTVFFTYCTLQCVFCQNFQLSHEETGTSFLTSQLAENMLSLQNRGCHNINLVTATQFLPWILRALREAAGKGLSIPVVYNCGGYERTEVIGLLNGIVDIYLPDMKYGSGSPALVYSGAGDYVDINRSAVREMFRQVGPLRTDDEGIAYRGLCLRHLVLPNGEAGTGDILDWLARTFDPQDLHISLMAQYRPLYKANLYPKIGRMLSAAEYDAAKLACIKSGFNGYYQELDIMDRSFVIDFEKRKTERLKGD